MARPANRLDLRWAGTLAGAAVVHGALVIALVAGGSEPQRRAPTIEARSGAAVPAAAVVQLVDGDGLRVPKGTPVAVLLGAADEGFPGAATHPLPNADRNVPGKGAASLGGGASGGPDTWTGRSDRGNIRQQIWNDPERYRLARKRTGRTRRSDESIARTPARGFAARHAATKRARDGEARGQTGTDTGSGSEPMARVMPDEARWQDADPLLNQAPARRMEAASTGTTRSSRATPLVDRGKGATETRRKGRTVDDVNSSAASNETNPMSMDLLRAQSGGTQTGVAGGSRGSGVSSRGVSGARGSGATAHNVPRGPARISVRARRQLPYFRSMYKRVDGLIRYPEQLALSLAQGALVARFTLLRDGQIRDLTIEKTSGYDAFDKEVRRALTRAAPFGRVPAAILRGRGSVTVLAPFAFKNPMIR